MDRDTDDIYDPAFVADLFDRCSSNYRMWSAVGSMGFIWLWRRQCVSRLPGQLVLSRHKGSDINKDTPQIIDLMAGTGEAWPHVLSVFPKAMITAIDISKSMHEQAVNRLHTQISHRIEHRQANVLETDLPDASADIVMSTFGLKTLTHAQQSLLAKRIALILRPGGAFTLIEASDPKGWVLRPLYRLHLDFILPLIERLFLKGAQDFSMLGIYTRNFGDVTHFAEALRAEGLFVSQRSHFYGCASSVAGFKPVAQPVTTP
ncbi:MAG: class I SAM-dependent methyltransferase [Paracoccaceae bacterium]